MITKTQKIWLWIFGAMFVIPEILWSPIVNVIYGFLQNSNSVEIFRPNFLTDSDNLYALLYTIFLQLIGILGSTIIVIKTNFNSRFKVLLVFVMVILLLITGFIFYLMFSLRHGIGF